MVSQKGKRNKREETERKGGNGEKRASGKGTEGEFGKVVSEMGAGLRWEDEEVEGDQEWEDEREEGEIEDGEDGEEEGGGEGGW